MAFFRNYDLDLYKDKPVLRIRIFYIRIRIRIQHFDNIWIWIRIQNTIKPGNFVIAGKVRQGGGKNFLLAYQAYLLRYQFYEEDKINFVYFLASLLFNNIFCFG